jgi:hypothetical protein
MTRFGVWEACFGDGERGGLLLAPREVNRGLIRCSRFDLPDG